MMKKPLKRQIISLMWALEQENTGVILLQKVNWQTSNALKNPLRDSIYQVVKS